MELWPVRSTASATAGSSTAGDRGAQLTAGVDHATDDSLVVVGFAGAGVG
jgi:hypothetical protein